MKKRKYRIGERIIASYKSLFDKKLIYGTISDIRSEKIELSSRLKPFITRSIYIIRTPDNEDFSVYESDAIAYNDEIAQIFHQLIDKYYFYNEKSHQIQIQLVELMHPLINEEKRLKTAEKLKKRNE